MFKVKKILSYAFFAVIISLSGCKDLLETEPPESIPPDKILSDPEGIEGLIVSATDRLNATSWYGRHFVLYADILADGAD